MSHESIALAKLFIEQRGHGPISIDDFDTFIIDNKMAKDPETDDVKDPAYKGFVQERSAAKRTLNAAAAKLNEDAFVINVRKAGEQYEVVSWSMGADESLGGAGAVVRRHADNKVASLKTMKNSAERLMRENPHVGEFTEAYQALAVIESEANMLSARVEALTLHFDRGVDAARAFAKGRMAEAADNNVVTLEHKAS